MRTWKCPQCGQTEEIRYDWLAEHGGPVCQRCDCDMTLQPEAAPSAADRAAIVERLADKAKANGLKAEDLDNIVHDLAAGMAADVNNGGLGDQLYYLVVGLGAQHADRQIDELIAGRHQDEED
jgi:hypothetical protein